MNQITLDELGTAFSFVISSIFANRLLISVRSTHYRDTNDAGTYLPPVHFVKGDSSDESERVNNTIELTTFNERTGL